MSAIPFEPCAGRTGALYRPRRDAGGGAVRRLLATFGGWRRRARDRAALAGFGERTLRDIGLSRADAEFLINKPFWRE